MDQCSAKWTFVLGTIGKLSAAAREWLKLEQHMHGDLVWLAAHDGVQRDATCRHRLAATHGGLQ